MASLYDSGREFAMLNLDWLNIFFVIFLFYLLTLSYLEIQLHNFFYGNSFFFPVIIITFLFLDSIHLLSMFFVK
jgi:hypothetical protein